MGSKTKTEGSQIPSPGGILSSRAQQMTPISASRWANLCRISSDTCSATYSFGLGVKLLERCCPCSEDLSQRWWRLFLSAVDSDDVLGFIESCSEIRSALVCAGGWSSDLSKGLSSRWYKGICKVLESTLPCALCVHPSPVFETIVTFLGWLKRLPVFVRPVEQSIDAYFACDRRIASIDFGRGACACYVPKLREIWHEWFSGFRIDHSYRAKHGSGSTADRGRVRSRKWSNLRVDAVAHICLRGADLLAFHEETIGNPSRVSRVTFVPKQAGKDRAICMEPAWLQYLQQGVKDQLVAYTHRTDHPLHHMVNIFSQENNRRLCALAYSEGYATIDLTDASDSVAWDLVTRLTKGLPLWKYLKGTRSTHSDVGGYTVPMAKFAPMGSALCFPIECYVFASVVELAYRLHFGTASRGHHSGCSVYGDDIIVPAEIYHLVAHILTTLGFVVNDSKSFSEPPYYESCGVEYCYGARIETIRHPRAHLICHQEESPEKVGLVTDLANTLYCGGYFRARRSFLKSYEESYVRIGSRRVRLHDLLDFGGNLISTGDVYRKYVWNTDLQASGWYEWTVEQGCAPTNWDFTEWSSRYHRRSRTARLRDLYHVIQSDMVWDGWSSELTSLIGVMGIRSSLLKTGEVQTVGSTRAGRARWKLRKKFHRRPA